MKKKIIATIVFLLIILGGFCAYIFVFPPEQEPVQIKQDVEESQEVEIEEVGIISNTDYDNNSKEEDEFFNNCFNILENTDATFFKIDLSIEPAKVIQMPKSEYQKEFPEYKKYLVAGEEGLSHFFNLNYRDLNIACKLGTGNEFDNANLMNPLFNRIYIGFETKRTLQDVFGNSVKDYFKKHKLELSCKDVTPIKLGFEYYEGASISEIVTIFKTKVKTDECTGDMSDIGMFADKGETKTITVKLVQYLDPEVNNGQMDSIYFEY